jgi:hypothetical protein
MSMAVPRHGRVRLLAGPQAGLQDRQPVPLRTDLFLVCILAQW